MLFFINVTGPYKVKHGSNITYKDNQIFYLQIKQFCLFLSREFLVTNAPSDLRSISYPGGAIALTLLLTARLISAYYGHISDCDETYNYWEPLHYLGKI